MQSRRAEARQARNLSAFISTDGNHTDVHASCLAMIFAGTPAAIEPAGTSFNTTAFAPMLAPSPIVIAPSSFAPAPTFTPFAQFGRIVRTFQRFVSERHTLADNAVIANLARAVDDNAVLMFEDHALAKYYGVGQLNAVVIAAFAIQMTVHDAERGAQNARFYGHSPDAKPMRRHGTKAGPGPVPVVGDPVLFDLGKEAHREPLELDKARKLKRTSNIELPTSNIEVKGNHALFTSMFDVRCSMFDVRIRFFLERPATDKHTMSHRIQQQLWWIGIFFTLQQSPQSPDRMSNQIRQIGEGGVTPAVIFYKISSPRFKPVCRPALAVLSIVAQLRHRAHQMHDPALRHIPAGPSGTSGG